MTFDDYNYDLYNKYILIDPNLHESDEEEIKEIGGFDPKTNVKQDDDGKSVALTDKILETNNQDHFRFDALDTRTEEEKAVKKLKDSNVRKKESMMSEQ